MSWYIEISLSLCFSFFFFNDTATTEIYTLSLHDALPISYNSARSSGEPVTPFRNLTPYVLGETVRPPVPQTLFAGQRSEEHTSELQSLAYLVCRLLLEKKKQS